MGIKTNSFPFIGFPMDILPSYKPKMVVVFFDKQAGTLDNLQQNFLTLCPTTHTKSPGENQVYSLKTTDTMIANRSDIS